MEQFIKIIRNSDQYIEAIYTEGGCYQFHLILKHLFPSSEPWINASRDHVVTKYKGKLYDITGEVKNGRYTEMNDIDIIRSEGWSFCRTKALQISECPACEEPIII